MPFDENTNDSNEQDTESNELIIAPTQATIERINVGLGDNVCTGDPLIVLTAMKMEVSNYFITRKFYKNKYFIFCNYFSM